MSDKLSIRITLSLHRYIGYTLFTVYAAYHALHSLEAFKILGRKTYAGQVGAANVAQVSAHYHFPLIRLFCRVPVWVLLLLLLYYFI